MVKSKHLKLLTFLYDVLMLRGTFDADDPRRARVQALSICQVPLIPTNNMLLSNYFLGRWVMGFGYRNNVQVFSQFLSSSYELISCKCKFRISLRFYHCLSLACL